MQLIAKFTLISVDQDFMLSASSLETSCFQKKNRKVLCIKSVTLYTDYSYKLHSQIHL